MTNGVHYVNVLPVIKAFFTILKSKETERRAFRSGNPLRRALERAGAWPPPRPCFVQRAHCS